MAWWWGDSCWAEVVLAGGLVTWVDLICEANLGQPRKFAVCDPAQLQHDGGWSGVLLHAEAKWLPAHFTHLGG